MGYIPMQSLVYITMNERILLEEHKKTYPVTGHEYSDGRIYIKTPNHFINRTSAVVFPDSGSLSSQLNKKELYLTVIYGDGWLGIPVIKNSVLLTSSASQQ
jgi:hypothetical protein